MQSAVRITVSPLIPVPPSIRVSVKVKAHLDLNDVRMKCPVCGISLG